MGKDASADAVTRDMPPLSLRASVSPDTVNEEKRTVELVWTTGARYLRGFFERYYEELSLDPDHVRMGRLNNGAPFLDSHDQWGGAGAVLGVVESARLEKGRGVAVVRFAKAQDDPNADAVFRKVKDGILQNVSVGYRVYKMEKQTGGEGEIPVYRAVDWEPFELSVVPVGADDGAGFRAAQPRYETNRCNFAANTKEMRTMADPVPPAAAPDLPATPPATAAEVATRAAAQARINEKKAQAEAEQRAAEAARQAERERSTEIRKLVRRASLGDDLADKFIEDGTPIEDVRAVILDHLASDGERTAINGHTISAGEDARDKFVRGASAWLFERVGVSDIIRQAAEKDARFRGVSFDPGEFRGMTLAELARESLERRGVRTRGLNRMDMIAQAFTRAGAYQTQSDFAVLLENVMFKTLLGAYAVTPDTWSLFCKVDTVSDFRASNRFRTGSLTVLDAVNEHGEFKNKAIPDGQKTSISVATKGNIVALSRQTIINDDLGALTDMSQKLGRAARLSIEVDVYALLALNSGLGPTMSDSQPFFHAANRGNVNGTGSALSVAGLDADRVVMASQKDISSNEYLDLRPEVLLVPVSLGGQAKVLNQAQYDVDNVGSVQNKFMQPNKVAGLFRTVVDSPRLSGTRRYLFASPAIAPAIVVAFLEGQGQAPVLESENGWRVDGVEWKVRLDYKAQVFDPKGAVTNAGA